MRKWISRKLRRSGRIFNELGGRARLTVVKHLLAQIKTTIEGTELATRMVRGDITTDHARGEISEIEHRGDHERARLVYALGEAITTPIDREDLYRLSRAVDDVLDNVRDFVRESDIYSPETLTPMTGLLEAVTEGLDDLRRAVAAVATSPATVSDHSLAARKSANQVRILYQQRLGDLFRDDEVTMDIFRMRELLRRLDVVALRLTEACDALSDAMLKRSM